MLDLGRIHLLIFIRTLVLIKVLTITSITSIVESCNLLVTGKGKSETGHSDHYILFVPRHVLVDEGDQLRIDGCPVIL